MSHEGGTATTRADPDRVSFGPRGPGRRGWLPVTLAVVVLAAAAAGLAVFRRRSSPPPAESVILAPWNGFGSSQVPEEHRATYTFQLMNLGAGTATITQVGRSGPGLRLVRVLAGHRRPGWNALLPALPVTVGGYQPVSVSLVYRVTRCDGLSGRTWPIPVTYRTRSGATRTMTVDPGSAGGGPWHRELTAGMRAG